MLHHLNILCLSFLNAGYTIQAMTFEFLYKFPQNSQSSLLDISTVCPSSQHGHPCSVRFFYCVL